MCSPTDPGLGDGDEEDEGEDRHRQPGPGLEHRSSVTDGPRSCQPPLGFVDCAFVSSTSSNSHVRTVILLSGLIVVTGVSLVMLLRGTDPIEVAATFFFAPVFVGLLYFGVTGGTLLALAAAAGYVALRWPAIDLVGWDPLAGRIAARGVGYLVFGIAGGWAASTLLADLDRLSTVGGREPLTGLHDAASLTALVRSEQGRCDRYGGTFSLVVLPITGLPTRRRLRRRALESLGRSTRSALRKTDHLAFVTAEAGPLLVAVLTGTGNPGIGPAIDHLATAATQFGLATGEPRVAVYPDDTDAMDRILADMSSSVTTTSPT